MDGCIRIRYNYDNKKYGYIYEEKTCSEYAGDTIESEVYGAIIYSYDRTAKSFVKDDSNEVKSTGLSIYDLYKNDIKIPGQTNDGLYDTGDEYVFRGSNVNNYVTLTANEGSNSSNSSWRILSINKKSNQVKLISTTSIASNVWNSNSEISFKSSSLNNLLLSKVSSDGIAYNTNKIINSDYSIGVVPPSEFSIEALRSALNDNSVVDNKSSQKVGTISVLDYVNASASNCDSNYLSDSCSTNNYLRDMFGTTNTTWTMNTDGTQIWYINNNGLLALTGATNNKQIYTVVTLDSNSYISNLDTATGTNVNPYIIK